MWDRLRIITSSIWQFVLPFLRQMMTKAGPVLATSALAAVKLVAENLNDKSGAEKRDLAFATIKSDLASKGVEIGVQVSTSMINAAIEMAVQKLKSI